MPYEYSAENHDWDLTLYAAAELIKTGLLMDKKPRRDTLSMGFSFFTGGMVLSFAAIESFSASIAFSIQSDKRFPDFSFQHYQTTRRFWDKMNLLMSAAAIEVDRNKGLFQQIALMQRWRNLVTHASPYEISPIEITDTIKTPRKLQNPNKPLQYARTANAENAKNFYKTAIAYIELVKERTGYDPHTSVSYKVLASDDADSNR